MHRKSCLCVDHALQTSPTSGCSLDPAASPGSWLPPLELKPVSALNPKPDPLIPKP